MPRKNGIRPRVGDAEGLPPLGVEDEDITLVDDVTPEEAEWEDCNDGPDWEYLP